MHVVLGRLAAETKLIDDITSLPACVVVTSLVSVSRKLLPWRRLKEQVLHKVFTFCVPVKPMMTKP